MEGMLVLILLGIVVVIIVLPLIALVKALSASAHVVRLEREIRELRRAPDPGIRLLAASDPASRPGAAPAHVPPARSPRVRVYVPRPRPHHRGFPPLRTGSRGPPSPAGEIAAGLTEDDGEHRTRNDGVVTMARPGR